MLDETISAILLYFRYQKLYRHAQTTAENALQTRLGDPILLYWRAIAMLLGGRVNESIRELSSLSEKRDLQLAGPVALIYAHHQASIVDKETVAALQSRLASVKNSAMSNDRCLFMLALFYWITEQLQEATGSFQKAFDVADGAKNNALLPHILAMQGWMEWETRKGGLAMSYFEKCLELDPAHCMGVLGKIRCMGVSSQEQQRKLQELARLSLKFPNFLPTFMERMVVHFQNGPAWDQLLETAHLLNAAYANSQPARTTMATIAAALPTEHVEAVKVLALYQLCKERQAISAETYLKSIAEILRSTEPNNVDIRYTLVSIFSRCTRPSQTGALGILTEIVNDALRLQPTHSKLLTEKAYLQILAGDYAAAAASYDQAVRCDSQNMVALEGRIQCDILTGNYQHAQDQMEFLSTTPGKSAQLCFLRAVLAKRLEKNESKYITYLKEALQVHLDIVKNANVQFDFYAVLQPNFLLEVSRELVNLCPSQPVREGEETHWAVAALLETNRMLLQYMPGSTEVQLLQARALFLANKSTAALALATQASQDASNPKIHLLLAQIQIYMGQLKAAEQTLETCVGFTFSVRSDPLYHLLRAKCEQAGKNWDEVLSALHTAQTLMKDPADTLTPAQKMSVYVDIADAYAQQRQPDMACETLRSALKEFPPGSLEEAQIKVAMANVEIQREGANLDPIIASLSTITPDLFSLESVRIAKLKLSNIYLHHKSDRKSFIRTIKEFANLYPNDFDSLTLLGDAHMNIQQHEDAIAVFEKIAKLFPEKALQVSGKIGEALVRTHHFQQAIRYYEELTANSPVNAPVRYELALLYFNLKRYDDAEKLVLSFVQENAMDLEHVMWVRYMSLLAEIYRKTELYSGAVTTLTSIMEELPGLKRKGATEFDGQNIYEYFSAVSYDIAALQMAQKNVNEAAKAFKDAMELFPGNRKAAFALARLELDRDRTSIAHEICNDILKQDPADEESNMLIAQVLVNNKDFSAAIHHLRQLLEKQPYQVNALALYIDMLKRNGKLRNGEVDRFLGALERYLGSVTESIEQSVDDAELERRRVLARLGGKASMQAGYHFCKALYHLGLNRHNDALRSFNHCRRDPNFSELAVYYMADIYLDADMEHINLTSSDTNIQERSRLPAIVNPAASQLLQTIANDKTTRFHVLQARLLVTSPDKNDVERAIEMLLEILNGAKDYIPGLLTLAIAYARLSQMSKSRNFLKHINKMPWRYQYAGAFEQAWLMLAEHAMEGSKWDQAAEYLKNILAHNRSCYKALTKYAKVLEKQGDHSGAAEYYEQAWALTGKTDTRLGYKLAWNWLRIKNYVEAIDVSHQVLKVDKNHPRIQKDVLEKARAGLRM